jgi:hypothetical protein
MTDDGPEHIAGHGLTLIIRKGDWSVDDWAEGGEKASGRGRGNIAHRDGRGKFVKWVGAREGAWIERIQGEKRTGEGVDVDEERKVTWGLFSDGIAGGVRLWGDGIRARCIWMSEGGIRAGEDVRWVDAAVHSKIFCGRCGEGNLKSV